MPETNVPQLLFAVEKKANMRWADKNYKGGWEQYYRDTHGGQEYKQRGYKGKLKKSFEDLSRTSFADYQLAEDSMLGVLKHTASQEGVEEAVTRGVKYAEDADELARGSTARNLDRADAGNDDAFRSATEQRQTLDSATNMVDARNRSREAAIELRDAARDSINNYRQGLMSTAGASLGALNSAKNARDGIKSGQQASMYGGLAQGAGILAGSFTKTK